MTTERDEMAERDRMLATIRQVAIADSRQIVDALIAAGFGDVALARAQAGTLKQFEGDFPCDGGCSDYAEECCSRHGRKPDDLWGIVDKTRVERDALAAQVAAVQALWARWDADLTSGCPCCGPVDDCDHIEGYHYAYSDLRDALVSTPAAEGGA